jgi:hypothetical protein
MKEPTRSSSCIRCVRGGLLLLSLVIASLGTASSFARAGSDSGSCRRRRDPEHVGTQFPRECVLLGWGEPVFGPHTSRPGMCGATAPTSKAGDRGCSTMTMCRVPQTPRTTSASAGHVTPRSRASSDAVCRRLLRHQCERRHDSRFHLEWKWGRHRAQHLCERGATAAVRVDHRGEYDHRQRSRSGSDSNSAGGASSGSGSPSPAETRTRFTTIKCCEPSATALRSSRPRGSSPSTRTRRSPGRGGARVETVSPRTSSPVVGVSISPLRQVRALGTASLRTPPIGHCRRTSSRRTAPAPRPPVTPAVAAVLEARVRRMFAETLRRRRPPPYTVLPALPDQPTDKRYGFAGSPARTSTLFKAEEARNQPPCARSEFQNSWPGFM